jgi:hypothetical protein
MKANRTIRHHVRHDHRKRLSSVKKILGEVLKASDLRTDHRGMHRSTYSFRQFHISRQLIAGSVCSYWRETQGPVRT